jgi:translin
MANLDALRDAAQAAFVAMNAARETALPKSRAAVRHCANAIRAIHRNDEETAQSLIAQARALIDAMREDLRDYQNIYFAGFVEDAQKEFAEAGITVALIRGRDLPTPEELGVEWAAYLNGMGEAVGELRRHVLDLLRQGRFSECEALLVTMDEVFGVLTALDFPDAITNGLRRTTDNARGIIERTRGDLTSAALGAQLSVQLTQVAALLRQQHVQESPAEE